MITAAMVFAQRFAFRIYGFERQRANLSLGDDVVTTEAAQETLDALPQDVFPSLERVAMEYAATPYDDAAAFGFGLDLIIDGLERLLERQSSDAETE